MNRTTRALILLGLLALAGVANAQDEYGGGSGDYDDEDEYGGGDSPGAADSGLTSHITGIVDVDHVVFDKVVLRGNPTFVTFYSTDEAAGAPDVNFVLTEVASKLGTHLRLVLAKVDITPGDAALLRARFGNRKAPFHLFFADALSEPEEYAMDADASDAADRLESWLVERTGHPFEIMAFSPLVVEFTAPDADRPALLKKAEAVMSKLTPAEALIGRWYMKTMANIIKKGPEYLQKEFNRLDRLINDASSSLKQDKIDEFGRRREVVNLFAGGKFKATSS